jgi:hypothetical protein
MYECQYIETKKVNLSKIGTKQTKGSCDRKITFFSIKVILFSFYDAEEKIECCLIMRKWVSEKLTVANRRDYLRRVVSFFS